MIAIDFLKILSISGSSAFILFKLNISKMRQSLRLQTKRNDNIRNSAEGKTQFEMIKYIVKVFFYVYNLFGKQ